MGLKYLLDIPELDSVVKFADALNKASRNYGVTVYADGGNLRLVVDDKPTALTVEWDHEGDRSLSVMVSV